MRKISRAIFLLGFCIGLSGGAQPSPMQAQEPITPDPRFGAIETYHAPEAADRMGLGWTRLLFYWSELEPDGADSWNSFHEPLERIDREIAGGREVIGMLGNTPAWATDGVPNAGVPRGLYLPIQDSNNLWAGFVRKVMTAYKGRINHWLIWNEPDIAMGVYGALWQGTIEDYFQLVKVAYLVAREVDPQIKIHLGGLTYWHNPQYLREYLDVASRDPDASAKGYYFDAVTAHLYFKPETTPIIIGDLRDALAAHGLSEKPIWLVETNAPPYDDPTHPWEKPLFPVTQDQQASFLLQEFAFALDQKVERIGVYKWIDQPPPPPGYDAYGMLRPDGDPRPAFFTLETIMRHYGGTIRTAHQEEPEMQLFTLEREGKITRVMWSRVSDAVVIALPALTDSGLLIAQYGKEERISPMMGWYLLKAEGAICPEGYGCFIGGRPVLLVENTGSDISAIDQIAPAQSITMMTLLRLMGLGAAIVILIPGAIWWFRRRRSPVIQEG
jgi:hypothetical protein